MAGGTRFFGVIDSGNTNSLRSHYRLGFKSCKWVLCFTLFGRTWYFKRHPGDKRWSHQDAAQELTPPPPMLASVGALKTK